MTAQKKLCPLQFECTEQVTRSFAQHAHPALPGGQEPPGPCALGGGGDSEIGPGSPRDIGLRVGLGTRRDARAQPGLTAAGRARGTVTGWAACRGAAPAGGPAGGPGPSRRAGLRLGKTQI